MAEKNVINASNKSLSMSRCIYSFTYISLSVPTKKKIIYKYIEIGKMLFDISSFIHFCNLSLRKTAMHVCDFFSIFLLF